MLVGDSVTSGAGIRAWMLEAPLPLRHSAGISPDFPRFQTTTTAVLHVNRILPQYFGECDRLLSLAAERQCKHTRTQSHEHARLRSDHRRECRIAYVRIDRKKR